jgi:hypothetical protein
LCRIIFIIFYVIRTNHPSAHTTLDIRLRQNSLKFPNSFFFNILNFVPVYCSTVVQTLAKLHELEFYCLWKKCDSSSDRLIAALYNLMFTSSLHLKWISGHFILTTFIRSLCDNYLLIILKCQKGRAKDVK